MTTKLKEWVIAFSRSKNKYIVLLFCYIFITLILALFFIKAEKVIVIVMAILAAILFNIAILLDKICKCKDEVLNKKNIVYLILSDMKSLSYMISITIAMMWLALAINEGIIRIMENPLTVLFNSIIDLILICGIGMILAKLISDHFKKKLSE